MKIQKVTTTLVMALLIYIICSFNVFGCIYNVRDIGFVEMAPNPYRLYCFIQDDTPENIITTLKRISYSTFLDSNIDVEMININQQKSHPAMEYFHFWEIKSCPAAILISPEGRSLVLPISISNKIFNEAVRSSFESVIFSSIREEILEHIIKAYCIVLFIEAKDVLENKKAYEIINRATQKIARIMGQLPKRIEEPPLIIVITQEMASKEKILLWSLDTDGYQVNEPHAAVIYGRGRRIGHLLKGDQITSRRLLSTLTIIGLSCDCGLDKKWMTGPLLPLRWDKKMQSDVVKFLGFDAENPMVRTEMNSIMSFDLFKQTEDKRNTKILEDFLDEYSEDIIGFESEQEKAKVSPAKYRKLTSSESAHSKSGLKLKIIFLISGFIVFLVLAGGIFILLRARKKLF